MKMPNNQNASSNITSFTNGRSSTVQALNPNAEVGKSSSTDNDRHGYRGYFCCKRVRFESKETKLENLPAHKSTIIAESMRIRTELF